MKRLAQPELFEACFIRILAKESKRTFVLQSINGRLAWRFVGTVVAMTFMVPDVIAPHYETFGFFTK
jgi:hypothetical protein